ncbi:hypothetical protein CEXT_180551 [Caerostris extrusa]|uniref:Uncharacterized protein n=1 Tax=Caerostris extrusa TaxID=172846 RepID=A0AAV4XJV4_CAEEX|nr:hypothetical protein CEXT_180551 [Caerostris extrusa]
MYCKIDYTFSIDKIKNTSDLKHHLLHHLKDEETKSLISSHLLKISITNMKLYLFLALAFCVAFYVVQAEAAPGPLPADRFARQATTKKPGDLVDIDFSSIADILSRILNALLKNQIRIG